MKKSLIVLSVFLIITACVTFVVEEDEVLAIIELINGAKVDELTNICQTPFLLDGEIIALADDVKTLWANLKSVGFKINKPEVMEITPVTDDTAKLFSDSWEVSVFFEKYVPENSVVAKIKSENGTFLLLLDGEIMGFAQILGFKGPEV